MAVPSDLPPIVRDVATGTTGPGRSAATTDGPGRAHSPESQQSHRHDRVEVSEYGRLLSTLMHSTKGSPDERAAVIAKLQAQIDAGTYRFDAHKVAERLLPALEGLE